MQPQEPITPEEFTEAIQTAEKIARRIACNGCIADELISIANSALMTAAGKFRREKGVAFAGYARSWITRDLYRGLRELKSPVTHSWNDTHDFERVNIDEMAEKIPAHSIDENQEYEIGRAIDALDSLEPEDRALLREYHMDGKSLRQMRESRLGQRGSSITIITKRLKRAEERFKKSHAALLAAEEFGAP